MSVASIIDRFEAVSEFWHHKDTCGQTAGLVLEHCKDGIPLNGDDVDAVRADMAAHGYGVQGGTTMSELVSYFREHRGLDITEMCPYGSSWETIHQALLDHAGRDGVILEVNAAYDLTDNEAGVHSHYVAIGGIDPVKGYLVANGDDVDALASHDGHGKVIPTRWMGKGVIESAQPRAVAIVRGLAHSIEGGTVTTPAPEPQPVPVPVPSRYFDQANINAFRDELRAALQSANAYVAVLTKALQSLPEAE